jgi:hypothetical protein
MPKIKERDKNKFFKIDKDKDKDSQSLHNILNQKTIALLIK